MLLHLCLHLHFYKFAPFSKTTEIATITGLIEWVYFQWSGALLPLTPSSNQESQMVLPAVFPAGVFESLSTCLNVQLCGTGDHSPRKELQMEVPVKQSFS